MASYQNHHEQFNKIVCQVPTRHPSRRMLGAKLVGAPCRGDAVLQLGLKTESAARDYLNGHVDTANAIAGQV